MGTVRTGSETRAQTFIQVPQPTKPQVQDETTLSEDIEGTKKAQAGSESGNNENGIRVSVHRKESLGHDVDGGAVETEISAEEGNLGDSSEEISKPVESSLLKMKKNVSEIDVDNGEETSWDKKNGLSFEENGKDPHEKLGTIEVQISEAVENNDGEVEDLGCGDDGHKFSVGDFVWGKVKSHPWWPGRVYDPSCASDYAAKLRIDGRLLVAYFGDRSFAWCDPSQLKPFEDNFDEMSKQSSSKSFFNALQQALDEIGRLLELKMVCLYVPKQNHIGVGVQSLVMNAGIKQGVVASEGGIEKLSFVLSQSQPEEILAELKCVACDITAASMLEVRVLQSQLSGFYYAKGCYELPVYHEPQSILGLEDDRRSIEVPTQGPFEDWLSSPVGVSCVTSVTLTTGSHVVSENGIPERRKQRSIADLMEGNKHVEDKTKDKKLMAIEGTNLAESNPSKKRKRGKESKSENTRDSGSPATVIIDEIEVTEETKKVLASKGRKKTKDVNFENDGIEGKHEVGDVSVPRNRKFSVGLIQSDDNSMKVQIESPRERKKSKYLSPPFINLIGGNRKQEIEMESPKGSTHEAKVAGHKDMTAHLLESCSETHQKEFTETGDITLYSLSSGKVRQEQNKIVNTMKVDVPTNDVLSLLRSVAVNVFDTTDKDFLGMLVDFMFIFRSSVYCNGPNYNLYNKHQSHNKRKKINSDFASLEEHQTVNTAKKSSEIETQLGKGRKKEDKRPDKPQQEQAEVKSGKRKKKTAAAPPVLKDSKEAEEKGTTAALFVTFGPGSFVPTKADLIRIYSKYGDLNASETDMFYNNFCARVSFIKSSDAEEAFIQSQNTSPFGYANVTFRLRHFSDATKSRELNEIPSTLSMPSPKPRDEASLKACNTQQQPTIGEVSEVGYIKQKLEKMISMLETSDGEVSPTLKSKLEYDMKDLLKKVSTMV